MPDQNGNLMNGNGASASQNGAAAANGSSNGGAPAPSGDSISQGGSIPVDWQRLARATAHPLRVSILEILGLDGGRTLSPSELCRELQIPLSNTNYHVTELHKSSLIELARERQVRGATEHFYRLPASTIARANGAADEPETATAT